MDPVHSKNVKERFELGTELQRRQTLVDLKGQSSTSFCFGHTIRSRRCHCLVLRRGLASFDGHLRSLVSASICGDLRGQS